MSRRYATHDTEPGKRSNFEHNTAGFAITNAADRRNKAFLKLIKAEHFQPVFRSDWFEILHLIKHGNETSNTTPSTGDPAVTLYKLSIHIKIVSYYLRRMTSNALRWIRTRNIIQERCALIVAVFIATVIHGSTSGTTRIYMRMLTGTSPKHGIIAKINLNARKLYFTTPRQVGKTTLLKHSFASFICQAQLESRYANRIPFRHTTIQNAQTCLKDIMHECHEMKREWPNLISFKQDANTGDNFKTTGKCMMYVYPVGNKCDKMRGNPFEFACIDEALSATDLHNILPALLARESSVLILSSTVPQTQIQARAMDAVEMEIRRHGSESMSHLEVFKLVCDRPQCNKNAISALHCCHRLSLISSMMSMSAFITSAYSTTPVSDVRESRGLPNTKDLTYINMKKMNEIITSQIPKADIKQTIFQNVIIAIDPDTGSQSSLGISIIATIRLQNQNKILLLATMEVEGQDITVEEKAKIIKEAIIVTHNIYEKQFPLTVTGYIEGNGDASRAATYANAIIEAVMSTKDTDNKGIGLKLRWLTHSEQHEAYTFRVDDKYKLHMLWRTGDIIEDKSLCIAKTRTLLDKTTYPYSVRATNELEPTFSDVTMLQEQLARISFSNSKSFTAKVRANPITSTQQQNDDAMMAFMAAAMMALYIADTNTLKSEMNVYFTDVTESMIRVC